MKKLILPLFFLLALYGCGQTGPLYLPDSEPPIHVVEEPPVETQQETNQTEDK